MRAVGVDLGTKRIGVALSSGTLATPYDTVHRSGDRQRDHRAIKELIDEADATVLVVGLPLSMDGTVGKAAQRALAEVDELANVVGVPVETHDERLSTVTADRMLQAQELDGRARRKIIDKVAATVILQSWLDGQEHDR